MLLNIVSQLYSCFGDYENPLTIIKEKNNVMILVHTLSKPFCLEKLTESCIWKENMVLLKMSHYKLQDLIDIALKFNMSHLNEKGKKKIKADLYTELFNKLN